ncbi:hypothetical protein GCM10011343_18990 [Flavobacterium orientale]|uniref:Uncharacterized protein n=1 Tax=Flavobacterium orientale TaxID=1756020 RepID=A0A916Y301_9FLAO|nr:hypothetical protein GCM10011343_18990 [Flavobacterium orientale]
MALILDKEKAETLLSPVDKPIDSCFNELTISVGFTSNSGTGTLSISFSLTDKEAGFSSSTEVVTSMEPNFPKK